MLHTLGYVPFAFIDDNCSGLDLITLLTDRTSALGYLLAAIDALVLLCPAGLPASCAAAAELRTGLLAAVSDVDELGVAELLQDAVVAPPLGVQNGVCPVCRMKGAHSIGVVDMRLLKVESRPEKLRPGAVGDVYLVGDILQPIVESELTRVTEANQSSLLSRRMSRFHKPHLNYQFRWGN